MQELLWQAVLQHEGCLFFFFVQEFGANGFTGKDSSNSQKHSSKIITVTGHNQMLFRNPPPSPLPPNFICFFNSLLKARLSPQLPFAQEGATYPSEACMSPTLLPLLTDLICFCLMLLERFPLPAGRCQWKIGGSLVL